MSRAIYRLSKMYGDRCHYCGTVLAPKEKTVDHIVPKIKGGVSGFSNYLLCCGVCNMKKSDTVYEEFLLSLWLKKRRKRVQKLESKKIEASIESDLVVLFGKNNGQSVKVARNGCVAVILEENRSTGYAWFLVEPNIRSFERIHLISAEYSAVSQEDLLNPLVGGGGLRMIIFQVYELGTYSIELILNRPWDRKDILRVFKVEVTCQ